MSSLISPEARSLFPLHRISDLRTLFKLEFVQNPQPNLALLSIILGGVEYSLINLDYTSALAKSNGDVVQLPAGNNNNNVISGVIDKPLLAPPPPITSKKRGKGSRRSGGRGQKVAVNFQQAEDHLDNNINDGNGIETPENGINSPQGESNPLGKIQENPAVSVEPKSEICEVTGDFPPLEFEEVEALYLKFRSILALIDLGEYRRDEGTPQELVKKVSDVIWSHLSSNYRADSAHIQSLYTYIYGKKLDSFGVALAVAAGCQVLGLDDVHLGLSEDHAWIIFGPEGQYSAEVTWHGKGVEDKRGQSVGQGDDVNSWIYLKGHALHCTRQMEVAAIVLSINFCINGNVDSSELIKIQQQLLWELYDTGNLEKYPMGLSCLAELEEIAPTPEKKPCSLLFQQSVLSARTYYNDMHVLPYIHYAGYLYRRQEYKLVLRYWADAAMVVQKYTRSKSDQEIYSEFLEISTDYLMNMVKQSSVGFSAHSIMRDPCSFAQVLRFFDGICMWEERSAAHGSRQTVHITWAKAWVNAIGKFDYTIRRMVQITFGNENGDGKENSKLRSSPFEEQGKGKSFQTLEPKPIRRSIRHSKAVVTKSLDHYEEWNEKTSRSSTSLNVCDFKHKSTGKGEPVGDIQLNNNNINNLTEGDGNSSQSTSTYDHSISLPSLVAVDPDFHSSSLSCSTVSTVSPSAASCRSSSPFVVKGVSISPTDSGIDEDDVPSSAVTLYSTKMQQLKDLLRKEKYNQSAITLLLTAQSATPSNVSVGSKQAIEPGNNGSGRHRRERLSHNVDKDIGDDSSPPRKKAKLATGTVNQPA